MVTPCRPWVRVCEEVVACLFVSPLALSLHSLFGPFRIVVCKTETSCPERIV